MEASTGGAGVAANRGGQPLAEAEVAAAARPSLRAQQALAAAKAGTSAAVPAATAASQTLARPARRACNVLRRPAWDPGRRGGSGGGVGRQGVRGAAAVQHRAPALQPGWVQQQHLCCRTGVY